MNIFRREMKAHRWNLVFWSLGMVFMVMAGMAKFAAYEQAGQSAAEIMAGLPKGMQVIFGLTGFDLLKASGFYGVLFLYLAVMGAVHAVLLGANLISKEERDRTSEFLFAKPASRHRVITGKLLAGLANVVILNAVTWWSSVYFVGYYGKGESVGHEIALLMVGLLFLQLMFLSIGAVIAGSARKPRFASGRATTVMLVMFVLYYVVNLNEKLDFMKYFTPFKYFDAALVMKDGLDPVFVALSAVIIGASVVGTYRFYSARDLSI
ncbi:MAG: ABC transporter [Actinobacteria bacterium]|nr:ABC transporter [Actinomycetota bacterium]